MFNPHCWVMTEEQPTKRPLEGGSQSNNSEEAKRQKLEEPAPRTSDPKPVEDSVVLKPKEDNTDDAEPTDLIRPAYHKDSAPFSRLGLKPTIPVLPPSLELVTGVKADLRARKGFIGEEEVGIIGYAGPSGVKGIRGVIKQR